MGIDGDARPHELVLRDRVHRSLYTDPEVFAEEIEKIYERTWVYVGHESEVATPGDYKTTRIGRHPIILTRDQDDRVHALINRCAHRGATVCQDPSGNSNFFRCAYHGWTYRNNGQLVGPTYPDAYAPEDLDPADFGLRSVARLDSYSGLIFASLSPTGPTLAEHLGDAKTYINLKVDAAPDRRWELRSGVHRYRFDGNWKLQMENSLDGYHGNFVHHTFVSVFASVMAASGQDINAWKIFRGDSVNQAWDLGNGHSLLDQRPMLADASIDLAKMRPGGDEYYKRMVESYGEERARTIIASAGEGFNLLIFPNLVFIASQVRVIYPCGPAATEVELYPAWLVGAPDDYNIARLRQHEMMFGPAGFQGPDDVEMFHRVQRGLAAEKVEWVNFSRGLGRQQMGKDPDTGGERLSAHNTDELPQRSFWLEWKRLMQADLSETGTGYAASAKHHPKDPS